MHRRAPRRPLASRLAFRGGLAPFALSLAFLAHCSFPEYSFRTSENETEGGAGGAPAAGRGGANGNAPAAGSAGRGTSGGGSISGSAGAGGGPSGAGGGPVGCVENCDFDVSAASAPPSGLATDGESVFWAEFSDNNGLAAVFAHAADGSGQVRTLVNAGQVPEGHVLVDMRVDNDAVYVLDLDLNQPPQVTPQALLRIPKAGGNVQTLAEPGSGRGFFNYVVGDTVLYVLREDTNGQPPAALIRVPKTGGNPSSIANARNLLGAEGDDAVVLDENFNLARVRPGSSDLIASDNDLPQPFLPVDALAEADAYYILCFGQVRRVDRTGGPGAHSFLSMNSGNDPFFLLGDGDSFFWLNRRGGTNSRIGDIHTVTKAGGEVQKLVENVAVDGLSVRDGVVYYVSNDLTKIRGRRLR